MILYQDLSNIKLVQNNLIEESKEVAKKKKHRETRLRIEDNPTLYAIFHNFWSNCNIYTLLPRILHLTAYIIVKR